MKVCTALWSLPLLGLLALPALAGRADHDAHYGHFGHDRIEQRMDRQHGRIEHGIRNGELTRKEARRLRKQQRHIAKMERKFTRDGHLDRYERRTLHRELDAVSDRIYRLKHNDHRRDHHRHGHGYKGGHDRHHDGYRSRHGDDGWYVVFSLWDEL